MAGIADRQVSVSRVRRWAQIGLAVAVASPLLIACVVDHDDRYDHGDGDLGSVNIAPTSSASASDSASASASASASDSGTGTSGSGGSVGTDGGSGPDGLVAIVDTNRSLNAMAGQGVGVFVEYDSGGHWNVTWTCDTTISHETCDFDLLFTIVNGNGAVPTNVQPYGDPTLPPVQGGLAVTSTVGAIIDGVTFDTPAGATLEMTTKLSGELDGAIVFFVQNGTVNGGYTGTLSDPLDFVGATP